jgi:transcriptional regulator with XRE-family HTH domain
MASTAQRTVRRLLLGREIAWLRDRVGVSQTELGSAAGLRQNRVTLLEDGRATITEDQLEAILTKLQVADEDHRDVVRAMHRDSDKRGEWNTGFRRAYGEDLRLLIELETLANQYFVVDVEVIPGMLQSEGYVRGLCEHRSMRRGLTVDEVVQAWQERQKILYKPDAPEFHFVLSESCLRRRQSEDNAVMREALNHLTAVSQQPGILLQVLPFDVRAIRVPKSSTLVRVPTDGRAGPLRMVYLDSDGNINYRDDDDTIDNSRNQLSDLGASALDPDNSRDFIDYIAGTVFK